MATLDVDLQDPPSLLPRMHEAVTLEGYDCAAARRATRKGESFLRSLGARAFYKVMNGFSDVEIVDGARDFRLMTLPFAKSVLALDERNRFSKGIYGWMGYKTKWFSYDNVGRSAGRSKWSFFSLFRYSLDGIADYSAAPLHVASLTGLASCLVAVLAGMFVFVRALFFGDPVPGWPSLAILVLLIGGLQLLCLGILGQYVAKVFVEVKHRPHYFVRETDEAMDRSAARRAATSGEEGEAVDGE